ncbi:glycosyltransferase family 8 protein [Kingella negevensis]|uniref:General stress protein A n=1 Tax=Kingella negevensis TaxID=1522312 RepID=A0A238HFF3_9NEIS|nr:glycosyltransferase family 8 protein [Kingella negevensis]MDK4680656.1 glycosyltransferase family 8 protein [Kingella negevensis]MDK4681621.1 glycosyltransferase family 8 protein [Kingella negevensis]MDK4683705.1 glycosyltransferase family 8 protein [Kingella negevensis]MDK4689819.1 glycosyltransferase family 8 protein [Kingella negevensis]MDK4692837.1 glycosyltransferase family 8 protein [Kingella negevensis]
MPNPIKNIVLAADQNYAQPTETLIKSIMRAHQNVHFYLIHKSAFPETWFAQINHLLQQMNSAIYGLNVQNLDFSHFQAGNGLPESSFYRIIAPQILPKEINRALYLDVDMIVHLPLDTFYWQDFSGCHAVAVSDIVADSPHANRIDDYPKFTPYFNSGVLLMNLPLWRETEFLQTFEQTLRDYPKPLFGDQDLLNLALRGKWLAAPVGYNYQVGSILAFAQNQGLHMMAHRLACPHNELAIIHYTEKAKPWLHSLCPYRQFYLEVANTSWEAILQQHFAHFNPNES